MNNKYYDKEYENHLVFFDDYEWMTPYEWTHTYRDMSGAYEKDLVPKDFNTNTKLPFVYRTKHAFGDDDAFYMKMMKDGTHCLCSNHGVLAI